MCDTVVTRLCHRGVGMKKDENMKLEVPKILDIPKKLLPIITKFNDYKYFLVEGGRSGGKSQAVARLILYLADTRAIRVVCGREIQKSVDESVYTIFADLIQAEKLAFRVLATEIRHIRNSSVINFRGFREEGRQNIKGMEGVDLLWVDEGQSITKETLDIIIPTIRKENSRIFWTMNRLTEEEDAVFNEFHTRPDCLHIHINYLGNKFCPQKMIEEAELCKKRSIEDYAHIWLGQPRKAGGVINVVPLHIYKELAGISITNPLRKRLLTADPSLGGDECVAYIIDQSGKKIDELFLHERDEMKIAGAFVAIANRNGVYDYAIDVIGFKGIADRIRELVPGCNMIECRGSAESSRPLDYLNQRAEIYMYAAEEIINKRIEYFKDDIMIKQLTNVRIKPITSRKIKIEDKNDIRKRIGNSPDRADAYVQGIWALQYCKAWEHWRKKADIYAVDEEEGLPQGSWMAA